MWPTFVNLCLALSGIAPSRLRPRRRPALCPRVEALEDRRLLSAGGLDPTFGNGAGYVSTSLSSYSDYGRAALIQPDGKILAAGGAYVGNAKQISSYDFAVVRYNIDGSPDTSFGTGGQALANPGNSLDVEAVGAALYPQAGTANDGKIVLAGEATVATKSGNAGHIELARFNANGTLDASFGTNPKTPGEVDTSFPVSINSTYGLTGVVLQPDGKIVAAAGSSTGLELARYNANGTLDTTFGSGGEVVTSFGSPSELGSLLLQPDGKLLVAGNTGASPTGGLTSLWELARYNASGSLDSSFGSGGIVSGSFGTGADVNGAALYPSGTPNAGEIAVVGDTPGGRGMARYTANGSLDSTFGTGGEVTFPSTEEPISAAIAADGKLLISGWNTSNVALTLARYNLDGTADATFGSGGFVTSAIGSKSNGWGVALYPSTDTTGNAGKIVVVGNSYNGAKWNFLVARYLPSEPEIGSFTASAYTVAAGSSVTLTASNITGGNPGATITQVAFYYVDGSGNQQLLGYGTQTSPGVWTFSFTVSLAPGSYTLYAQATDSFGAVGDPVALTLTVQ
jgi:uncharacterized delta-60 repeat protein